MATAFPTRDDALDLRDRMRGRVSADIAAGTPPPPIAVLTDAPIAALTAAVAAGSAAGDRKSADLGGGAAAAPPSRSVLGSSELVRNLHDRVHERGVRAPVRLAEPVKDIYPHEQPFPVRTVLEYDRVAVSTGGDRGDPHNLSGGSGGYGGFGGGGPASETLLMAAESAAVVRALERRLGDTQQRAVTAELTIEKLTAELKMAKETLEKQDATINQLKIRNDELNHQISAVRRECQATMETEKAAKERAIMDYSKSADANTSLQVSQAVEEQRKAEARAADLEHEVHTLATLVAEMKDQLTQNGAALQNHTLTIRDLTNDLLAAKYQAANVALGLQAKDKQLRELQAEMHAKATDLARVGKLSEQLKTEVDLRAKAELELKDLRAYAEAAQRREKEHAELIERARRMEQEMTDKGRELHRLRGQVETVKSQADAAYLHSAQFRGETAAVAGGGGALGYGGYSAIAAGPGGYGAPPPAYGAAAAGGLDPIAQLRRDVEEEEKRANEELRRWRAKHS